MKRKFVKVMFFGALALSTVTYVGCKDYDDDINAINERIDANDAKLAEIQKVLDSGQWVKDVKPIANGIQVVLGNEKTYDITNGKDGVNGNDGIVYTIGDDGYWYKGTEKTQWKAAGDTPYIKDGNWWIGNTDLKVQAEGKDGNSTNGTDGLTPYIKDGNWWIGEGDAAKNLGVQAAADIYTPDASGIWYVNGKPTDPAQSWKAEGTITAAVNEDGNIVISGMKEYPEGFVLKTNTAVLSSLVFEPQSYLGGIQAMKAISLNYNEWTVKTSDATPTKTGEVWQRNTTKVNVLTPKIVAYYHVNPQNISESQIVEKSVHYVADNKEVVTRSQEFNPTVTSYKLVDKEIDGKNCRMLKVTFSATSEEIKALDAKEVSTLALQVSVQLKDEKEPRVITSDYAAIYKTNWSDFVLAFKDKVNNNATNDGHLYGADDNDSKIGQALEAIEAEANFALTATVDAKDPKKLVLKDKFTFHYKETADKTDADPSEEKVFEGDLADLDLEIAFAQSNYISGDNKTPQNAFLKLEDGEAISTVYGEPGVAAADRQPMVRVMLREIATKKVLNAGWVKINIVKDDVDGKEIDYPKHEEIYVGCDDAAVTTDVQFMNVDVYNALGLKKDEFYAIYKLNDAKTNPATGDNSVGKVVELQDPEGTQTILVEWTIDNADLLAAKEGDTFTKKVYYSATGRKDVVIILTTGKVHKASGTIGAKNTNLWSGNSIEIDAKEPIANNKATLADFDFYSVFMGNKIVTTVDSKFTDFQPTQLNDPKFVFAEENGVVTAKQKITIDGVDYYVYRNDAGDKLMGAKGTGVAEEVAVIVGSKVTYNKTAVAKALLNKSAYNENPFTATIEVVITNKGCNTKLPLTNGKFDAKFLRPVNIMAGPVSTIQDAETGGAKVALNQLISLTDWRGHDFEMGTNNFYTYYGISAFAIATDNIKTNMGQTDPNKFVLWSEVAPLYPNVVTYAAGTDTSNNLTAIENGDFGMVTYDNKGVTVKTSFKLQIPVTVSYPYGDVTKVITVTVLPTHG